MYKGHTNSVCSVPLLAYLPLEKYGNNKLGSIDKPSRLRDVERSHKSTDGLSRSRLTLDIWHLVQERETTLSRLARR